MASGSFYNYPTQSFGVYCEWTSTPDSANNQSTVVLKTYLSYYTINVGSSDKWETSINGEVENFTSPAIKVSSASAWTKKLLNTRTEVVKHNSDGTKQITLSASYPFHGKYSGISIGVITASKTVALDSIKTKCTAPSTFTVISDKLDANGYNEAFETKLTLEWKNAKAGIGNAITGYQILYATNSDNATWSYSNLQKIDSTATSGKITIDMSSKISRGNYVRFRIQTLGSAGSSYYSDVTTATYSTASGGTSYSVKRQPYTKCEAPTSVTASSNNFDSTVKIEWSGAKSGISNSISSYYIQYATSSNNSTWGSWTGLTTVNSTSASGNTSIDMSSKVSRGYYVKFRIRTQGSAGGSYYSEYKESASIRRQAYTNCVAPTTFTLTDTNATSTSEFKVKLDWSGAKNGTANSISSYYIWYATSASQNSGYSDWKGLASVASTTTSGTYSVDMSANVTRGYYIKFRIQVRGSAGSSYYSDYKETNVVRRNPYTACTAPTTVTLSSDVLGSPFENSITIQWSGASGGTNNNIASYIIRYSTSIDNATWSSYADLATVTSTATSGSETIDVSAKVTRGHYIKLAIRTRGSAGSTYYSEYAFSVTLQRNPYTKCTAPTQIILTSEKCLNGNTYTNVFEKSITMNFSGAKAGENNTIKGYSVQYRQSDDKVTWDNWRLYESYESTNTSENYEFLNIANIARGKYIQFQIATLSSQSGYDSDYVESPIIRKNSVPSNVSAVNTSLSKLEYSYGDNIIIGWNEPNDIDSNIYKYQIILYQNINGTFTNILEDEVIGANTFAFTLDSSNEAYQSIKNNEQIKFAVRPIDVFGLPSENYTESQVIIRYDNTGVCIGINDEWVDCQIYVGTNGKWVEQSVSAGIGNAWSQCGLK